MRERRRKGKSLWRTALELEAVVVEEVCPKGSAEDKDRARWLGEGAVKSHRLSWEKAPWSCNLHVFKLRAPKSGNQVELALCVAEQLELCRGQRGDTRGQRQRHDHSGALSQQVTKMTSGGA